MKIRFLLVTAGVLVLAILSVAPAAAASTTGAPPAPISCMSPQQIAHCAQMLGDCIAKMLTTGTCPCM